MGASTFAFATFAAVAMVALVEAVMQPRPAGRTFLGMSSSSQFPIFPRSFDEISSGVAGSICDALKVNNDKALRMKIDLDVPELSRGHGADVRAPVATADDPIDSLLLDIVRGVAQNLAVKGYRRVRVFFNTVEHALAARDFMRTMNPYIVRIDSLGVGGVVEDDELVMIVRPCNLGLGSVGKMEAFEEICCVAARQSIPVALLNEELVTFSQVDGSWLTPMILRDFETVYWVDPNYYRRLGLCGVLRRYPRVWEVYRDRTLQGMDFSYIGEFDHLPSEAEVETALRDWAVEAVERRMNAIDEQESQ